MAETKPCVNCKGTGVREGYVATWSKPSERCDGCNGRGFEFVINYEYCIMRKGQPGIHRGPMSEKMCDEWIWEFIDDGGKPGAFYIARRVIGDWEKV